MWQGTKRAQCQDAFMVTMFQSNLYHARQALNYVSSCWKLTTDDTSSLFSCSLGHHGGRSALPAQTKCSFTGLFASTQNLTGQSDYCYSSNQRFETFKIREVCSWAASSDNYVVPLTFFFSFFFATINSFQEMWRLLLFCTQETWPKCLLFF